MKRRPPRSTRPDKLFPDLRVSDLRFKSYHDEGTFTPIQVASRAALEGPQECVSQVVEQYRNRRDVLAKGLHEAGWMVDIPKASMYIWAKIPEAYHSLGSLEFSKRLLADAKVAVSHGLGFGAYGDDHVRLELGRGAVRERVLTVGEKQ